MSVLGSHIWQVVREADAWLDGAVADRYKDQPLAQDWARVAKVGEELGEAIDELIKLTGQNPRKGVCGTEDDLLGELADTALTAILAIQHFTKDAGRTDRILTVSFGKLASRIPACDVCGAADHVAELHRDPVTGLIGGIAR